VTGKANLAASVAARLLNHAARTGRDYQTVLTSYCLERFLYRLGASDRRERFVLKGAMLLRLWSDTPYRATRDLDLLRRGDRAFERIRDDLKAIVSTPVPSDSVSFDPDNIEIEAIRAEDEYAGARATLTARLGTARLSLQIDMGVGDAVWPAPQPCSYPTFLDFPAPQILAYPREAVIAEKFEAMVVLGDRNSRIKDFFDVHYLAGHFGFDRAILREAIRQTFERRRTPIPRDTPIALTREYWGNPSRPTQARAFSKRARISVPDDFSEACPRVLSEFLSPILNDLRQSVSHSGTWDPGGPWR
jgi:Nucleotidyl transferase AbiEii toxin, Type IV TA system